MERCILLCLIFILLTMSPIRVKGQSFVIKEQSIPQGYCEVVCALSLAPGSSSRQVGMAVGDSLENHLRLMYVYTGRPSMEVSIRVNGVDSTQVLPLHVQGKIYLKIRKANRQYTCFMSLNGEEWVQVGSSVFITFDQPSAFVVDSFGETGLEITSFEVRLIESPAESREFRLPSDSYSAQPRFDQGRVEYANPIYPYDAPDPTILKYGEYYYAVTTHTTTGGKYYALPILRSEDLVHWEPVSMVFPESLPRWVDQAEPHWWAPDLTFHNGKFYVYYSAVAAGGRMIEGPHGIGVAWAHHPEGPYELSHEPLVVGPGFRNIDPMVFVDDDGTRYLYWGSNHQPLLVQELSEDGLSLIGEPQPVLLPQEGPFIIDADRPPRPGHEALLEGIWVIKREDYYYLFYSGDDIVVDRYAVGVARSNSPLGPFEKNPHNPIMLHNEKFTAPGHNTIIQDDAGQDWIIYHARDRDNLDLHRIMLMDKIHWVNGWPVINDGQGPTFTWQEDGPIINGQQNRVNVARNKPVRVSSEQEEHRGTNAVDGNLVTQWKAELPELPQWLIVDLENVYDITQTEQVFQDALRYVQYKVETSLDGKTWEIFADRTDFFQDRTAHYVYRDNNEVSARYVKITITGLRPGFPLPVASIRDLRVIGTLKDYENKKGVDNCDKN